MTDAADLARASLALADYLAARPRLPAPLHVTVADGASVTWRLDDTGPDADAALGAALAAAYAPHGPPRPRFYGYNINRHDADPGVTAWADWRATVDGVDVTVRAPAEVAYRHAVWRGAAPTGDHP